ncbi:MAG: YbaK/EbsC family protein [Rhodospirillaceae bacterium]|nr:YbaK/EbsC family protein [Rhodospirillaceae bacterium]
MTTSVAAATPQDALPASAEKVRRWLLAHGCEGRVVTFAETTRTAAEAAAAIGCTVAQIAKSILFRAEPSGRAVLVITSGVNRVDPAKVAAVLGERLAKADAAFVREKTGFVIGGVPPVAHAEDPVVFIDADLMRFDEVWAAAGTPNAVFPIAPQALARLTGGRVLAVS